MKNITWIFIAIYALSSCSDVQSGKGNRKESNQYDAGKSLTTRDESITKINSYSDLFLDSTTVEHFISGKEIPSRIARRIISFYNARNYQFAWFSSDGLTEQARGFWNLHEYITSHVPDSSLIDKKLQKKMDDLVTDENLSVNATSKGYIDTELTLTHHFIHYILNNYEKGYVKRKEMERFIPAKKQNALHLADSLINKKHKDDKYFEDVNSSYRGLKKYLTHYYAITRNGGWPRVPMIKVKKGKADPAILILKKRLQLSGDLAVGDTSPVFTKSLEMAIRNFQERHGFNPTGKLNEALLKEMNVPVISRLQQLLMNMDRMRWLAAQPTGNLIVVNIPEFIMHVYEGSQKVFDIAVVVGKEGHNTTMFNGDLNQVVFSPYWNIPPSIVRNEILPAMEEDPNYLASENMEIVENEGELPVIRQRPGAGNALGRVKFLFPNSFNIYFHDTPSKSLFEKDKRAFSHGCIRLEDPEKMANYVLRNQPEWTPEKISEAMYSGNEKFVKVKDPIPVVITYYTAWVDEQGRLNFREDIYDHDRKLAAKMFL